jgi:DNA-binding response OmpR family regulator
MKILIVEDTPDTVEAMVLCFNIGFPEATVLNTARGREALRLTQKESPDIVILDLGLPDKDGVDVLKEIRAASHVPVIIVTARGEEINRVKGLEAGADDYILKPFSHTEFLARVRAVMRRSQPAPVQKRSASPESNGQVASIDMKGSRVVVKGREINLTPTEWSLLAALVQNEGKVVDHLTLAEKTWGSNYVSEAAVKMVVHRLRNKLGDDPKSPKIIRSHRGFGYSFGMPI